MGGFVKTVLTQVEDKLDTTPSVSQWLNAAAFVIAEEQAVLAGTKTQLQVVDDVIQKFQAVGF